MEGVSLFKARFHRFAYKRHIHDAFAVGVIEAGAQSFCHQGTNYVAPPGSLITVNPGAVHDGKPFGPGGYQYRMAYVKPELLDTIFEKGGGGRGRFLAPVTRDDELAARLFGAMSMMDKDGGAESQSYLIQALGDLFFRHSGPVPGNRTLKDTSLMDRICDFIRDRLDTGVSLREIADAAGMSQYHFLRTFKASMGLPPHAYIIRLRVKKAKQAIESGASIVDAAALAGFSDQSHLTRHFKSFYGLTPGQYRKTFT